MTFLGELIKFFNKNLRSRDSFGARLCAVAIRLETESAQ